MRETDLLPYIDLISPSVALQIAPEHREAVAAALAILIAQGEQLLAFPLDSAIEAAPHYQP